MRHCPMLSSLEINPQSKYEQNADVSGILTRAYEGAFELDFIDYDEQFVNSGRRALTSFLQAAWNNSSRLESLVAYDVLLKIFDINAFELTRPVLASLRNLDLSFSFEGYSEKEHESAAARRVGLGQLIESMCDLESFKLGYHAWFGISPQLFYSLRACPPFQ